MSVINPGNFLGDKDLDQLISKIDNISSNFQINVGQEDELASKAIEEYISSLNIDDKETPIGQLLQSISIPTERISRYKLYDEIFNLIPLIKRIIRVYINNVIQKDVLNNKSFNIKEKQNNVNSENYQKVVSNIIDHFKLEDKLKNLILQNLLRKGDFFIEVVDLKEDVINLPEPKSSSNNSNSSLSSSLLLNEQNTLKNGSSIKHDLNYLEENQNIYQKNSNERKKYDKNIQDVADIFVKHCVEIEDTVDDDVYHQGLLFEDIQDKNTKNNNQKLETISKSDLNRFILKYHTPDKIVILNTKNQNFTLGYLLIQTKDRKEIYPGISARFASVIHHTKSHDRSSQNESQKELINKIINNIVKKVINKTNITKKTSNEHQDPKKRKEIQKAYEDQLHTALGDEMYYTVKQLFDEIHTSDKHSIHLKRVNVRFIPYHRIVHFCLDAVEYFPYGTSKLDSLTYTAKMYLLTQLSNVVTKLSRASLFRKWTVETGPRDQDTNLMQRLKRQLRNQKVSVDDIVSVKSVPKILSDFKDMVVLSKKGQKFVDVDVEQHGDPNVKVQDLKDLREELIALSGVPAPYLGYHDVVDLREQLVNINVTFATEIVSVQDCINNGIANLLQIICRQIDGSVDINQLVEAKLRPPVVLVLQFFESVMSSIGNIQQALNSSGVQGNPYYLLKKFIPSINWDEYAEEYNSYKLFQQAKGESQDQQSGGGMY